MQIQREGPTLGPIWVKMPSRRAAAGPQAPPAS
jgi:hypothetical protein